MKESLIDKVHKKVNERISKDYPLLGMASLPEGHIKKWEVRYVLESYKEVIK